jgi:mersacidin/lichenicidin family type 2 lantibiotic
MSKAIIIRAWRDEEFLLSLSAAERALLPQHPAGLIELNDEELEPVAGGLPNPTITACGSPDQEADGCEVSFRFYCP